MTEVLDFTGHDADVSSVALTANCPVCHESLQLTEHGAFNSWVCPAGHGLAATLSELYERAQEDEIHVLWKLARAATPGPDARLCPMGGEPMVTVSVPTDADEVDEGQPGDGPTTAEVPVDVCTRDEVIWFDAGELDELPADLLDAQPTEQQEAALADIRKTFGEGLVEGAGPDPASVTERIAARVARSGRAFGLLTPRTPTH